MTRIECILGAVTSSTGAVLDALDDGQELTAAFEEGSGGDIELSVDVSQLDIPLMPGEGPAVAFDLHEGLGQLTSNPTTPGRVSRIAVIYADAYEPEPTALGVMFDRGFSTPDDPNDSILYTGVPREGCAVFLEPIQKLRGGDAEAIAREILFTTVHELGHVFNLPHRARPVSFMTTSEADAPFPMTAHEFVDDHKELLGRCSDSPPNVAPGGSDYADIGTLSEWVDGDAFNLNPFERALRLDVSIEPSQFWAFEPVELDIRLSVSARSKRRFRIPNAVDSGYSHFQVWIEQPNGERRLHRSPRHYCHSRRRLEISAKRPFERDISIFGEAGGFTFRQSGLHFVWVEFDLGHRGRLVSNTVEISVLPSRRKSKTEVALESALVGSGLATFAYYRRGADVTKVRDYVAQLRSDLGPVHSVAALEYALARALLRSTRRGAEPDPPAADLGRRMLESSLSGRLPGRHRRALAERFLDDA